MTTPEALKALYVALGGDADDVATANTSVDVLNAIAVKFEGNGGATLNPDAIMNVVAVLDNMIPDPTLIDKNITANGTYNASSDEADGYKKVVVNVEEGSKFFLGTGASNTFYIRTNALKSLVVPEGYTSFHEQANDGTSIKQINTIKEIYLPSTFTTLERYTLASCESLEKLVINKPEGSISGAPWGAPASCQIIWAG